MILDWAIITAVPWGKRFLFDYRLGRVPNFESGHRGDVVHIGDLDHAHRRYIEAVNTLPAPLSRYNVGLKRTTEELSYVATASRSKRHP